MKQARALLARLSHWLRRDILPEDLSPANIRPITDKTGHTTPETYGLGTLRRQGFFP